MSKKNSFGIDADPAEFSLDEWLSGATLPARSVKVYRDAGLRAEYDELEQRFLLLGMQVGDEDHVTKDATLGETTPEVEQYEVAVQMKDLIERMESSALVVKVRALSIDEMEKVNRDLGSKASVNDRALAMIAAGEVFPKLGIEGWKKLRNAIGEAQFGRIADAASDANGFTGSQVMPDFSPAASALLTTRES